MKRIVVATLIASLASHATPATAQNHLASLDLAKARLTEANQNRSQDLATLLGILSRPEVREGLTSIHVDPEDLAAKVSTLSDAELRGLAERAARLEADPSAGGVGKALLITFAVVGVFCTLVVITCATSGCD